MTMPKTAYHLCATLKQFRKEHPNGDPDAAEGQCAICGVKIVYSRSGKDAALTVNKRFGIEELLTVCMDCDIKANDEHLSQGGEIVILPPDVTELLAEDCDGD
jgi:hypothetical protein